ncbi:DUF3843 family protein [Lepagella muris]|jgi:hypothetical protein|uniref:DUF3843 family protein n=1 Tax=Lepagella muris TaxID=3032870 RepID=A0AC61RJ51_9BACT|nr:DUF3843 family protein [Lepagella muris]ROT01823.1 DUF3843 family protein [Muribaculaceae bacterium Isolate-037 (Harlan)]TGY80453.1 DUF3843 family protein [Lepagella muris]THG47362.1 DUF3843 family protein [Bacteroidales bacterium]TKC61653.1 DUF3843 family protein [Bacteroidales bacterium]
MITMQQFLLRQPCAPEETTTDAYYLSLANRLVDISREKGCFASYPEKVVERAAMTLVGYYQDVICDAGVWRSFITECRRLYGFTVPFYYGVVSDNSRKDGEATESDNGEDYLDYELNRADVRFMVWYALSMNYEEKRVENPFSEEILMGADAWWEELERVYDDSPMPVDYRMTHELEIHAEEDSEAIYRLGNWLFMHCYLMTPAYALTLSEIASGVDLSKEEGMAELRQRLERSMSEDPTGPLALYLREWLYLIVEGKLPPLPKGVGEKPEHKYYTAFTRATGGEVIKFFSSYEEMNRFFIIALGWGDHQEHLPQLKGRHDYILMVSRDKGMLVAVDIARCISHPSNPIYDKEYARHHAIELLTERGRCPGDLLRYVCSNGWLPDAVFPGSDDHRLVADNWDFISRCYLQQYYRGD